MAKRWLVVVLLLLASGAIGCGRSRLELSAEAGTGGRLGQADAGVVADLAPPRGPDLAPTLGPDLAPDRMLECEVGVDCPWPPLILAVCGDGVRRESEGCDDANTRSGDGCAANCTVELGWKCVVPGRPCTPICGDGLVVGTETCDDRNRTDGDGCSYLCLVEPCWTCSGDVCVPRPPVVDGGNCHGLPVAFCGDGVLQGAEECDQGFAENTVVYGSPSGCSPDCLMPHYCGDGYLDADHGEMCDLGVRNGISLCSVNCFIWMP